MKNSYAENKKNYKSAWFLFDPYSMLNKGNGFEVLTGLDVEFLNLISTQADVNLQTKQEDWSAQIEKLKSGEQDIITSAFYTEERAKFAYYSIPYRREENSYFVRKGDGVNYSFKERDMKSFVENL